MNLRVRIPPWPWIVAVWTGVGLIDASQTVFPMRAIGMHHAWVRLFATRMLQWLPWALATPLVIRLGRRFPLRRTTSPVGWLAHLGTVTAIGLIDAAWSATLEILADPWGQGTPPGSFLQMWLTRFAYGQLTSVVLYAFILTIDRALESQQSIAVQKVEAAQLSEQLYKARLEALRRQLEPHFLFNSLNAVSGLIRNGRGEAAVETIVALGEFLRSVAEDAHLPQVPLEQEVRSLQRYLEIQRARFAERLQVTLDVPDELLSAQVPSLILQPLVENAIRHGIAKLAQGGAIQVTAANSNGALSLSVANDGPSLSSDWETQGTGIGVSNLRARLKIMYGAGSELRLRNRDTGGVEARVSLPLSRM